MPKTVRMLLGEQFEDRSIVFASPNLEYQNFLDSEVYSKEELQSEVALIEQGRMLLFQQNIALGKQLELTQKDYNEVKEELLATLNDRRERERKLQLEVENLSKYETERVKAELTKQAEWFFERMMDMWCNAPESCGIEGDFICYNCKMVESIRKMYEQKYLSEGKRE